MSSSGAGRRRNSLRGRGNTLENNWGDGLSPGGPRRDPPESPESRRASPRKGQIKEGSRWGRDPHRKGDQPAGWREEGRAATPAGLAAWAGPSGTALAGSWSPEGRASLRGTGEVGLSQRAGWPLREGAAGYASGSWPGRGSPGTRSRPGARGSGRKGCVPGSPGPGAGLTWAAGRGAATRSQIPGR